MNFTKICQLTCLGLLASLTRVNAVDNIPYSRSGLVSATSIRGGSSTISNVIDEQPIDTQSSNIDHISNEFLQEVDAPKDRELRFWRWRSNPPTAPPTKVHRKPSSNCSPTKKPVYTPPPTPAPVYTPPPTPTTVYTPSPTKSTTKSPAVTPTNYPSKSPTLIPTISPTKAPTNFPTKSPTVSPTSSSTKAPTKYPTATPSVTPTTKPTVASNFGFEFWFVDTPNYDGSYGVSVGIANQHEKNATVSVTNMGTNTTTTISILPGDLQNITFPARDSISLGNIVTSLPVYHVISDISIVVFSFHPLQNVATNDATLVLPVQALGTSYRAASYQSALNFVTGCFIDVVAANDNTTVSIYDTNGNLNSQATINKGELYQSIIGGDVTAWRIITTKPSAVFTGSVCTAVGNAFGACDTLVEQILPENEIASSYVVCPSLSRPLNCSLYSCAPDIYRYVPTQDNTSIDILGQITNIHVTKNTGQFYELQTNDPHVVAATNPLYVFQYLISQDSGSPKPGTGDPSLIEIPPVAQYLSDYTFLIPVSFPYPFISVAMPVGTTLTLDGVALNTTDCHTAGSLGGVQYCCGTYNVGFNSHRIVGSNPFSLTVVGFGNYASYGYIGGTGLAH